MSQTSIFAARFEGLRFESMGVYRGNIVSIIERPALPESQEKYALKLLDSGQERFQVVLPESKEQILVLTLLNIRWTAAKKSFK